MADKADDIQTNRNPEVNAKNFGTLNADKQQLETSIKNDETAYENIQNGSNEAVKFADNNFQKALQNEHIAYNFSKSKEVNKVKNQITSINTNISDELTDIENYNADIKSVETAKSLQSEYISDLKISITNFESQTNKLEEAFEEIKDDKDNPYIATIKKSVAQLLKAKRQAERKKAEAEKSEEQLEKERGRLRSMVNDSESAINQYINAKVELKSDLTKTENQIEYDARSSKISAKENLVNTKNILKQKLNSKKTDAKVKLKDVNSDIAEFENLLPEIEYSAANAENLVLQGGTGSLLNDKNKNSFDETIQKSYGFDNNPELLKTSFVNQGNANSDSESDSGSYDVLHQAMLETDWNTASQLSSGKEQAQEAKENIDTSNTNAVETQNALIRIDNKLSDINDVIHQLSAKNKELEIDNISDLEHSDIIRIKNKQKELEAQLQLALKEQQKLLNEQESEEAKLNKETRTKDISEKEYLKNMAIYNEGYANAVSEILNSDKKKEEK